MLDSKLVRGLMVTAIVLSGACSRPAEPPKPQSSAAWTEFVNGFVEATFKAQPFFAVYAGRHEFDGQMPDLSKAGIEAETARFQAARAAALAVDSAAMSEAQKFERDYLVAVIDNELFWRTRVEQPFRNPRWYINQLDPDIYLSRTYAPIEQRLRAYIGYARAIPGIATAVRTNLQTPMPKSFAETAVNSFGGFAQFYQNDVPKMFAAVSDAELQQQLAAANASASKAMSELKDWFVAQRKSANDNYALGPELFAEMVRQTEGFDTSIAAIKAAGEADVARNTAALKEACAAFAPGKSLAECVALQKSHKPSISPVERAREQLRQLHDFVVEKNLVSIPGTEEALVAESPPYNRYNSAYIVTAGPFEKNQPSVYNISPPDPTWSKKEQDEYVDSEAGLLNTSVHEVWPGHFLQFLHSNRNPSLVGRLFVGYAFAEGWAHYSEELMWDMGLGNGNPQNRIAQLKDALWRDVRLLSAIGLHTEGMTVAQSEKLFREVAFDDAGNARQQAARGTFDPAYLNYTLGKLAIKKLRDDWIARQSAGKSDADPKSYYRAFHDQFLSYGGPPIPLVRRAMLGADSGPVL